MADWRKRHKGESSEPNPSGGPSPSEPGSSKRASWRKGQGPSGGSNRPSQRKLWRDREVDPTAAARFRYRVKLIVLALAACGMTAALIWYLLRTPRTLTVVVRAPDNARSLWLNTRPFADKTQLRFTQETSRVNGALLIVDDRKETFSPSEHSIQFSGPDRSVVFYLAGIGVADQVGDDVVPFLLPSNGDPLAEGTDRWLRVDEVLQRVIDAPIAGGPGHRLVILDVTPADPLVSIGPMWDAFPSAVQRAYERLERRDELYVIVSHRDGQRNWTAPELGSTAFGYYVWRGLLGYAAEGNPRVSYRQLCRYVDRQVRHYVQTTRQTNQRPLFLGPWDPLDAADTGARGASDFPVAFVDRERLRQWRAADDKQVATADTLTAGFDVAATVDGLWQDLDALDQRGALGLQPLPAARATALLVRLEQLLLDFQGNAHEAQSLVQKARDQLRQLEGARRSMRPVSFAEARVLGGTGVDAAIHGRLRGHFDRWSGLAEREADPALMLDEAARKEWSEQREELRQRLLLERVEARVWSLLDGLGRTTMSLRPSDFDFWLELIDASPTTAGRALAADTTSQQWMEVHFLRLLREGLDWESGEVALGELAGRAIRLRLRAEEIVSSLDPRGARWLAGDLQRADAGRREAEDLLFANRFEEAAARWRGSSLADAYDQLQQRHRIMVEALRARDRALRLAPYYLAWLARQQFARPNARLAPNEHDVLTSAIQTWIGLSHDVAAHLLSARAEMLDDAGRRDGFFEALAALIQRAQSAEASIEQQMRVEWDRLRNAAPDAQAAVRIASVLMLPNLPRDVRQPLREKYFQVVAQRLASIPEIAALDEPDAEDPQALRDALEALMRFSRADSTAARDVLFIGELRGWWPEASVWQWSQPQRLPPWPAIEVQAGKACRFVEDDRAWHDELWRTDHALRRAAAYLAEQYAHQSFHPVDNPWSRIDQVADDLQRLSESQFVQVQLDRVLQDFWGDHQATHPEGPYFYRIATNVLFPRLDAELQQLATVRNAHERAEELRRLAADWRVQCRDYLFQAEPQNHPLTLSQSERLPAGVAAVFIEDLGAGPADSRVVDVAWEGRRAALRRLDVTTRPEAATAEASGLRFRLPPPVYQSAASEPRRLRAMASFRGHWHQSSFRLQQIVSEVSETVRTRDIWFQPTPLGPPIVSISGDGRAITDVVFVIDCSGSMGERGGRVRFELAPGQADDAAAQEFFRIQELTRFEQMKNVLKSVVEEMDGAQAFRVALVAFGSRVHYLADERGFALGGELKFNGGAEDERLWREQNVQPYNDADVVIALPRSTLSTTRHYQDLLNLFEPGGRRQLSPFGMTPLYRGIHVAAEHLQQNSTSSNKLVIVITDGVDQTNKWDGRDAARRSPEEDLRLLLSADGRPLPVLDGISLQIIGFDLDGQDGDQVRALGSRNLEAGRRMVQERIEQMKQLAQATGGQVFLPQNILEVRQHLLELVHGTRYSIVRSRNGQEEVVAGAKRLYESWQPGAAFLPGVHLVRIDGTDVQRTLYLQGGETVKLRYTPQGDLVFDREISDAGFLHPVRNVPIGTGRFGGQYQISRFTNPRRGDFNIQYAFANENPREFSYRPQRVCLEIQSAPPARAPFVIQDFAFIGTYGVPVASFPPVSLEPGDYVVTLYFLPFIESPGPADQARVFPLVEGETYSMDGIELITSLSADQSQATVEVRGNDPQRVRRLLVDLWARSGTSGTAMLRDLETDRKFAEDGTRAWHLFRRSDGQPLPERLEAHLSALTDLFRPEDSIQFEYQHRP